MIRVLFAIVVSIAAFAFIACAPPPIQDDPIPLPQKDASALAADDCGVTCLKFRMFGCREGKPHVCEHVCGELVEDEMPPPFSCLARAEDVVAVRKCGVRCLP